MAPSRPRETGLKERVRRPQEFRFENGGVTFSVVAAHKILRERINLYVIAGGAVRAKCAGNACKHDRKNTRHENPIECSGSADGGDWRA